MPQKRGLRPLLRGPKAAALLKTALVSAAPAAGGSPAARLRGVGRSPPPRRGGRGVVARPGALRGRPAGLRAPVGEPERPKGTVRGREPHIETAAIQTKLCEEEWGDLEWTVAPPACAELPLIRPIKFPAYRGRGPPRGGNEGRHESHGWGSREQMVTYPDHSQWSPAVCYPTIKYRQVR